MSLDRNLLQVAVGDHCSDHPWHAESAGSVLVVPEVLRSGPLVPSPTDDSAAFLLVRAHHLARVRASSEADERAALSRAWLRIDEHDGPIAVHVDAQPCVECATFTACVLESLHRAGRGVAGGDPDVRIVRDGGAGRGIALRPSDIAAGAGAWRLLAAGDDAGLTLMATDLEGSGGMRGMPELVGLLVTRARGDVSDDAMRP